MTYVYCINPFCFFFLHSQCYWVNLNLYKCATCTPQTTKLMVMRNCRKTEQNEYWGVPPPPEEIFKFQIYAQRQRESERERGGQLGSFVLTNHPLVASFQTGSQL